MSNSGGRSRNEDGRWRRKRSDTLLRTLREQYDREIVPGRGDQKLGNILDRTDKDSLNDRLNDE